jgi:hypothetical protein
MPIRIDGTGFDNFLITEVFLIGEERFGIICEGILLHFWLMCVGKKRSLRCFLILKSIICIKYLKKILKGRKVR